MTELPTDIRSLLLTGHVLDRLRELPADSVQCVVTSPPYWGLRSYGTEPQVWGGQQDHPHDWQVTNPRRPRSPEDVRNPNSIQNGSQGTLFHAQGGQSCSCGAWRGELGSEPTPELFVSHIADVFDEVRRVLRPDGTLWLNFGDTYTTHPAGLTGEKRWKASGLTNGNHVGAEQSGTFDKRTGQLPEKNLVGIPWRVAFELQRRGWFLRSDIIWAKPNPMPESVTDRPTRSHEYIFLLTKESRYFYDADAVRGKVADSTMERWKAHSESGYASSTLKELAEGYSGKATKPFDGTGAQDASATKSRIIEGARARIEAGLPTGANLKTVWEIATQAYAEAHFATFPTELPSRCIRLGTSEKGCCPKCGAPWERSVERTKATPRMEKPDMEEYRNTGRMDARQGRAGAYTGATTQTTGFSPTCSCPDPGDPIPCVVLDPFAGSGTTLQVARSLGRRSVGIDLNPKYVGLARTRAKADTPDIEAWEEPVQPEPVASLMPILPPVPREPVP